MQTMMKTWATAMCYAALTLAAGPVFAEMSAEELAKLAQNPVGNLISVPFQNNTNLNFGPEKGNQNVLNIQPVIPVSVNDDWNIITRTIVPVISIALSDQLAHCVRQLEGRQRAEVDSPPGRRCRQDSSLRQAAGQHAAVGLLQRGCTGLCRQLADPYPGPVDVSQVGRLTG